MRRIYILFAAAIMACMCLTGCSMETKEENGKVKDLDFTVIGEDNLPEELKQIIEEKKEKEFKVTYQDNASLYICVGYGKQETGGYSITVNDLYLTANSIYVDTNLIGPEAEKRELYENKENGGTSYPYIVLKIEYLDKPVVFD